MRISLPCRLRSAALVAGATTVLFACGSDDGVPNVAPPAPSASSALASGKSPSAEASSSFAEYVDAETLEKMAAQEPLMKAADTLRRVAVGHTASFAGIALQKGEVVLYWKGPLSTDLEDALASARKFAPVTVAEARHSRAELVAAAAGPRKYVETHPGVFHSVGIKNDGSGLEIARDSRLGKSSARSQDPTPPPEMGILADVSTTVVEQPPLEPYQRHADTSPFYGGARIVSDTYCTAGWPVSYNGIDYMLTAAHCGYHGQAWYNGDGHNPPQRTGPIFMGNVASTAPNYDLMLIRTSTYPRVWDGGPISTYSKTIAGWRFPYAGQWVCASGASAGVICNIQMTSVSDDTNCYWDRNGNWQCAYDTWIAIQNGATSQPGDSGGPVFEPLANGGAWNTVVAEGVIFGGTGRMLGFQDFGHATLIWPGLTGDGYGYVQ